MSDWSIVGAGRRPSPLVALIAAVAALAVGASLAYTDAVTAGILFVILVVISRSREAVVTLWLSLRVLMFSGYVPNGIGELMLATITVTALARRITSGRTLRPPRSALLWPLLLLLIAFNVAYHGFDSESQYYARLIFGENILLLILIANTESRWARDGVVTAVAFVLAGIGMVAGVERVIGGPLVMNAGRTAYESWAVLQTFEGENRLGSILLQPNLLAAAMVLGFIVWTGIALESRGLISWLAPFVATGLLGVALLTVGRAVFLGAVAGLGVLFAFAVVMRRISVGRAALATAGVIAAAFLAIVVIPGAWFRLTNSPTDPVRIHAAETAVRIIEAHPIEGLGAGWNRYLILAEPYRTPGPYSPPLANPHNSFLEIGAMLGLPVAFVIVLLIGKGFSRAWPSRAAAAASAIPFAGMTVVILIAFTADLITIPVLSNLFWALWAVAGAEGPRREGSLQRASMEVPRSTSGRWSNSPA